MHSSVERICCCWSWNSVDTVVVCARIPFKAYERDLREENMTEWGIAQPFLFVMPRGIRR